MDKSIKFLKSLNILPNDYIVVGCSSGPDSMCLLDLLFKNKFNVICAHVNHNIRKESAKEYKFLKNYCEERNILFEGLELPVYKNKNESYYRKARYNFYKKIADKYNTKYIATAHHGDDLIETILMRITRGSNLKGYVGFNSFFYEKGYIMLKPLIYYTKDDIIKYDQKNNIPYNLDKTNDSDLYTRNRYRHNVLPFLKSENEKAHEKYLKFSDEISKARDYIQNVVLKEKKKNYSDNRIDLNKFLKLDNYIKECELESILSEIYGDDIDKVHDKHIENILEQLKNNKNFIINLPKLIVKREYDYLYFLSEIESKRYKMILKDYNELDNGYIIKRVDDSYDTSNFTTRLNSEELSMPLYIRTRLDGDKIEIKNLNGSKKIKDIFINEKVSPRERDIYPILVDSDNNIVWLPGLKKSKFDNKKTEKYDIILRYERKEK